MISLLVLLALLLLIALSFLAFSMRKHWKTVFPLGLILILLSVAMYGHLGAYSAIKAEKKHLKEKRLAELALKELKTPEAVISRLKQTLSKNPNSAKGWYLLGRIYSSLGDNPNALKAYQRAYRLDGKNIDIRIELLQALYVKADGNLSEKGAKLLKGLLDDNPKQIEALNFIAVDAFRHKKYEKAVAYWQRVLVLLPKRTNEYQAILKAITKAQKQIQTKGEKNG